MWHFSAVLVHRHLCSPNFLENLMFHTTYMTWRGKCLFYPINFAKHSVLSCQKFLMYYIFAREQLIIGLWVGPDSSVGIATRYGLDGPGIESRWGRDCPDRPWGPPSLLYNGRLVFSGGKAVGMWR
jgi:hypothetical protein